MTLATATALDLAYYQDPAWLAFEQQHLFEGHWQLAGHSADVAFAGDHIVTEVAGKNILIVRDADGTLRAFHNVCAHRAGPLARCNGTGATRLRCLYHGWTFGLDGRLITAPGMREAEGFDSSKIRLMPVAVVERLGLVFVDLSGTALPIDTVLAGIAQRLQSIDIGKMRFLRHHLYTVECNWKVYIDNYLEGHHLPYVHPKLTQTLDFSQYSYEETAHYSLQHAPIVESDGAYGLGTAYYYFIFPNIMLNITPGRLQSNRVYPLGRDRCTVEFNYFYEDSPDALARVEADHAFSDLVQAEDAEICGHVQRGILSGGYAPGRLSPRHEGGVFHFQQLLRQAYAPGIAHFDKISS